MRSEPRLPFACMLSSFLYKLSRHGPVTLPPGSFSILMFPSLYLSEHKSLCCSSISSGCQTAFTADSYIGETIGSSSFSEKQLPREGSFSEKQVHRLRVRLLVCFLDSICKTVPSCPLSPTLVQNNFHANVLPCSMELQVSPVL
jgi:hypothetical protein